VRPCRGAAPALGGARPDEVTLGVCQSAEDRQHQAPAAGGAVGSWLCHLAELPPALAIPLTMPNWWNVERGQPVDAGDCQHIDDCINLRNKIGVV
jgi:hypothetical protein